tara:strand:- start:201 stop:500 length:300 start_codon:yes stop_codon:yes gene_type:complete
MYKFANLEFTPLQKNLYSSNKITNEISPDPVFTAPTLQKNETYTTNPKGMWWVCGDGMGSIKYTSRGTPHIVDGVVQTEYWIRKNGQWVNTGKPCPNSS